MVVVVRREAFVIGSGPNGLTAAITLARAGMKVTVFEAQPTLGGGARSAELTLPGFTHDVCSAVHPLAISSPAFATMPLHEHGLEWIKPPVAAAHPLDNRVSATPENIGENARWFSRAVKYFKAHWNELLEEILAPPHLPAHPVLLARFGLLAALPANQLAKLLFRDKRGRAWFAGMAAHSILPLDAVGSGAFGLVFALSAQIGAWPIPRGGSQRISDALASYFESLGGVILKNHEVTSISELPRTALTLCDVTPRQLLRIAADRLPDSFRRKLERYKYGPGVFKLDWALDAPIPWRDSVCAQAGTVHVGGTLKEIAASERAVWQGAASHHPFVLLAQPSLFDSTRAPAGKHTAWAYCHVPNGSKEDMTRAIEDQIARFAPGFRETILARHTGGPAELEQQNANLVGGDITGGAATPRQLLFRPTSSLYGTPCRELFICSSSTPPGAGVHGMCGYYAAKCAIASVSGQTI